MIRTTTATNHRSTKLCPCQPLIPVVIVVIVLIVVRADLWILSRLCRVGSAEFSIIIICSPILRMHQSLS